MHASDYCELLDVAKSVVYNNATGATEPNDAYMTQLWRIFGWCNDVPYAHFIVIT